MPVLPKPHLTVIVTLVEPFCRTERERHDLLDTLFFASTSRPDIDTSGAPLEFTRHLIFRLIDYGEVSPGVPALWALLDIIIRPQVGFEKGNQIDRLKDNIFVAAPTADYELTTEGGKLIFLSYATGDKVFADRLRADLSAAGLNLWIDHVGLKVGTPNWEDAIRDALKRADGVLLIASPNSRRSNYVRDESTIADDNGKTIYPVWMSGDTWSDSIPLGRGFTQYVDLRGDKYNDGLRKLIRTLIATVPQHDQSSRADIIQTPPLQAVPPDFKPRNPYKGLKAFRADDRDDFFGREALVSELIHQLRVDARFLGVIGASGSGKSSVVMAGLLPRLRSDPVSSGWIYLDTLVPGKQPIEALSTVLARQMPQKPQAVIVEELQHISTRGLHRLAKQISDTRLVVYIDQFEELFTQTADEAERRQFIDLITTAAAAPDNAVTIILTLRADFYDRPLSYSELGALIETRSKAILPLTLADLYDVILKPAARDDVRLILEPGLTEEMVFSVKGEAGSLPLLQFTLEQLFQRRDGLRLTRAAYNELGRVRGALASRAEETYQALDAEGQNLARSLFLRLIEPGVTEQDTTRRRAHLDELETSDPAQTALLRNITHAFVDARLLTAHRQTIEVSHEALVREWPQLAGWLRTAREDILLQQNISRDTVDWMRKGQREGDLLSGLRLADALGWLERNKDNIVSHQERKFIEESARVELKVETRTNQLAALNDILARITAALEREEIINLALDELGWIIPFEVMMIWRRNGSYLVLEGESRGTLTNISAIRVLISEDERIKQIIESQRVMTHTGMGMTIAPHILPDEEFYSWMGVPMALNRDLTCDRR